MVDVPTKRKYVRANEAAFVTKELHELHLYEKRVKTEANYSDRCIIHY